MFTVSRLAAWRITWKSALIPFFARIPRRFGNLREMRYGLLTDIVPLPDSVKRRTAQAYFGLAQHRVPA